MIILRNKFIRSASAQFNQNILNRLETINIEVKSYNQFFHRVNDFALILLLLNVLDQR